MHLVIFYLGRFSRETLPVTLLSKQTLAALFSETTTMTTSHDTLAKVPLTVACLTDSEHQNSK
jgi:hypothetical protein